MRVPGRYEREEFRHGGRDRDRDRSRSRDRDGGDRSRGYRHDFTLPGIGGRARQWTEIADLPREARQGVQELYRAF